METHQLFVKDHLLSRLDKADGLSNKASCQNLILNQLCLELGTHTHIISHQPGISIYKERI